MTFGFFNNAVDVACKLGEIKWAIDFRKTWARYLPESKKEDAINLAKATIAFSEKDFLGALKLIDKKPPNDIHFKMRIRWISLCCHFELQDSPEDDTDLVDYFKNYDNFFSRQKEISTENIEGSLNLLRFVRYLYNGNKTKEEILEELEQTQPIYFKTWLLEKLQTYKPKK